MTRFDLHPEDLLERASRGTANAAELTRLAQHLSECDVCRVERALLTQAASDAAPLGNEKLVVARLKRAVTTRAAAPTGRHAKRKGAFAAVALAAATVASVAAAATLVIVRGAAAPDVVVAPPSQPPPPPDPPRAPERAKTAEVQSIPADPAKTTEPIGKPGEPAMAPSAARAGVDPENASELFSRANQARRDGRTTEAVRLYRALQDRFSGTGEELVSRVTLGRLLLDRLGDSRGALVQFNSYLASPGGGALREEAMVGRALSLGRLGRAAEEHAAWQALLHAFPQSTQHQRAQARLLELGGSAAGTSGAGSGAGRARGAR
jgi:hypothetical protein